MRSQRVSRTADSSNDMDIKAIDHIPYSQVKLRALGDVMTSEGHYLWRGIVCVHEQGVEKNKSKVVVGSPVGSAP
jgi:hypothetical protein